MAIDEQANTDLSLSEEDAENVVGGQRKSHKKHTTHTAAPTYQVDYIKTAGATAAGTRPSSGSRCTPTCRASSTPAGQRAAVHWWLRRTSPPTTAGTREPSCWRARPSSASSAPTI